MTTLYLARHGETEWHAEHRYAGSSDVALTEHGPLLLDYAVSAHLETLS